MARLLLRCLFPILLCVDILSADACCHFWRQYCASLHADYVLFTYIAFNISTYSPRSPSTLFFRFGASGVLCIWILWAVYISPNQSLRCWLCTECLWGSTRCDQGSCWSSLVSTTKPRHCLIWGETGRFLWLYILHQLRKDSFWLDASMHHQLLI
jgi:hypothetical protein